jgi:hypothetical protein
MMKQAPQYETFQILVSSSDNTRSTTYQVNLSGRYRVELVGYSTQFSSDPAYLRAQIVSPQLVMSKGNLRYANMTQPFQAQNQPSLKMKIIFDPTDYNGYLNLCLEDTATGATPANFTEAVLTFIAYREMDYPYEPVDNLKERVFSAVDYAGRR